MIGAKGVAALLASNVSPSMRFSHWSSRAAFCTPSRTRKLCRGENVSSLTRSQHFWVLPRLSQYLQMRGYKKRSLESSIGDDVFESNYDEMADLAINERLQESSRGDAGESAVIVKNLLGLAMGRAVHTLSSKAGPVTSSDDPVEDLLSVASSRASATLETYQDDVVGLETTEEKPDGERSLRKHKDKRQYLGNPCVTGTALAQTLWSSVIIPNVDTVIDATCGNGKDALAIAEMLFTNEGKEKSQPSPELLCIDIQQRACENTQRSLMSSLRQDTFANHIRVLATSHAPLPRPRDERSVGLIAYNLGYLPGTNDKDIFTTKMITTLFSLTDAALLLRVGGLLSVMTYPGTCLDESNAVKHFCEGLAMLTTRDPGGWQGYVENIPADTKGGTSVRDLVRTNIERVVAEGYARQTWRVFEHKPLGRPLSPILVTATRIK